TINITSSLELDSFETVGLPYSLKETQSTAFDIQEQSQRRHRHNRRTPAVTHEREGNSHDGEHARRHTDIDHNAKTQHAEDADRQERSELILRARHNFQ